MTRDEADNIHVLFMNVQNVTVDFDLANNLLHIVAIGPIAAVARSFHLDEPVAINPTTQTFTGQGSQTITLPTIPTNIISPNSTVWTTGPQPYTQNNGTYTFAGPGTVTIQGPVFTPAKTSCTCGADSVGGKHSGYCDKGDLQ